MGKSKKSSSLKNKKSFHRYLVKIDKNLFLTIKDQIPLISDLKITKKTITFETNHLILPLINEADLENVKITDRYQSFWETRIKKNLIAIICLLMIFIVILTSQNYITKIIYTGDTKDQLILDDVLNSLEKKGPFLVLTTDLESIAQTLRSNYPHYAWIGLDKVGSCLEIEIIRQDTPQLEEEDLFITGHLYAKESGVIKKIIVERGVVVVNLNQSVNKGDLLVSGNANYILEPQSRNHLIRAKGVIIASTLEYRVIKVAIETTDWVYTGQMTKKLVFNLLESQIDNPYQDAKVKEKTIFRIGNFCRFYYLTWYQKVEVTSTHTLLSASQYAQTIVHQEFLAQKVSDHERIVDIMVVSTIKYNQYYEIALIVKSEKNIAMFEEDINL